MNYLFLTDKIETQKFLNENSIRIFGQDCKIEILDIKRFKTFNEENSLNVYYELKVNDVNLNIRVSTSTFLEKEHDYNVMKYFFNNGFDHGSFLVPQPLAYLKGEKILIYKDVPGRKLTDLIERNDNLEKYVKDCSALAKKIHSVKIPNFSVFDPKLLFVDFKFEKIEKRFTKAKNMPLIVQSIESNLPKDGVKVLCHGDFNPNNILIDDDKICLIDFSMTTIFYKEIDLASFLSHSRIMLNDESKFEKLKDLFLNSYGDFDERNLYLLMSSIDCRLLEIATLFNNENLDVESIWNYLNNDLKKANIKIETNET